MLKTSTGIIFRTVKYGETSVILDIFSPDHGVQSYIIGGVRKRKASVTPSLIAVLNFVRFVFYEKKTGSLLRIKEIQFDHVYRSIPFDIVKSSLALFLTEVLKKSLRGSDSNDLIYSFVRARFLELDDTTSALSNYHIKFLLDLTTLLGFEIHNNYDAENQYFNMEDGNFTSFKGDVRYILLQGPSVLLSHFLKGEEPSLTKAERHDLLKHIVNFYRYHIDGFGELRSLPILTALYE